MADPPRIVALLGGGVIGGGWAARFALNGIDVRLYDPAPDAQRTVDEVLANARRALRRLTLTPLPPEGRVTFAASPEEAVEGAGFVQESAPEREDLKRDLLARASRVAPADVVIASSTSGLLPSRLQAGMEHPERMTVGHPFNPVYLLPLVELCGGERTAPETLERAGNVYRRLGMSPLVIRREIDAFVADRLLEALWREALWLVADDIATVEEVDDAISLGAGLRAACMGPFLTYRIAGGAAGMRHFLEHFGPALELPWSKLTDVPRLTDGLVDKVVAQSDAQAAGRDHQELERLRDDCLVALIQGLRAQGAGAGAVLAEYERSLFHAPAPEVEDTAPLRLHETVVAPEWIDYNGHAHESTYLRVFGDTTDALLRHIGLDPGAGSSYFTVETHISHIGQARVDERLHTTTQLLGHDAKRLHLFHALYRTSDGELLATGEHMLLHVDTEAQRTSAAKPALLERLDRIARAHAGLPRPERAGRAIAMPPGGRPTR
jgi:carnitine 3-dehydrogenase / betainyl-CoA thioesterase